jgi:hypothetical protein
MGWHDRSHGRGGQRHHQLGPVQDVQAVIAAGTTCEDRLRLDGAGDGGAQVDPNEFDP